MPAARARRAMPRKPRHGSLAGVAALAGVPLRMRPEATSKPSRAVQDGRLPRQGRRVPHQEEPNGQYFSVADISEELTAARVIESERSMIHRTSIPTRARLARFRRLKRKPRVTARQNRAKRLRIFTPKRYHQADQGARLRLMLEEHPEVTARSWRSTTRRLDSPRSSGLAFALPGRAKGDHRHCIRTDITHSRASAAADLTSGGTVNPQFYLVTVNASGQINFTGAGAVADGVSRTSPTRRESRARSPSSASPSW